MTTSEKLDLIIEWADGDYWAKKNFDKKTMAGIQEQAGTTDYTWPTPK